MIKKILAIVLVVLVVAVCAALVVVNIKFQAVTSSPVVSHKTLLKPETRIQVVVNVPLLKGIIEQQFLKDTGVPPWVLPLALPNEVAVLADANLILGDMNLTLFINDKRLGPVISQKLNEVKLPPPAKALFPNPMEARGRGKLLREGTAKLNPALMDFIKAQWPTASVDKPLDIEGGHMIEVVVDNRDGGAMAIIGTLAAAQGIDVAGKLKGDKSFGTIPTQINSLRIQADVTPDDTLKVHFTIDSPMAPWFLVGIQTKQPKLLAKEGVSMLGINIQSKIEVKGNIFEGVCTVSKFTTAMANLSGLLAMAGIK